MSAPVILITGATRGIGLAAAQQLSARGAKVIIASRDPDRAAHTARSLDNATSVALDITDPSTIEAAAETISKRFGHLDVLINNAAVLLDKNANLFDTDPALLAETLMINVIGTLRVTQVMRPLLQRADQPRVINISSGAGQLDGEVKPLSPAYAISKTALNMLTQQIYGAWPEVIVNSMCPGWCRTDMGGAEAPRSAAEGADTAVWLALDAPPSLRAQFLRDRQPIPW